MYVNSEVAAGQVGFFKISYAVKKDQCQYDGDMIESEELSLKYSGVMEGGLMFELTDKVTGEVNPVGFSLRYWAGYQIHYVDDNQPSGVYIFRPTEGQYESLSYSEVSKV